MYSICIWLTDGSVAFEVGSLNRVAGVLAIGVYESGLKNNVFEIQLEMQKNLINTNFET